MDSEKKQNSTEIPEEERYWVELENSFREVEKLPQKEKEQVEKRVSEIWNRMHNNGRID